MSPFREINPDNEALTQLRPFWDKILVAMMRKAGVKELTLDLPDLTAMTKDGKLPYVVVLGRKHIGPHGGFTICIADTREEIAELLAKHQGQA